MTHMVTYRSAEGQPVYHPTESLEEAARHVEQLRNAGQGADARIFRLEEVPMEVKTYYKVELPGAGGKVEAPAPAAAAVAAPAEAAAPAAVATEVAAPAMPAASAPGAALTAPATAPPSKPEPAGAGANGTGGRFGLFGKG
jgi:hypothetical protein